MTANPISASVVEERRRAPRTIVPQRVKVHLLRPGGAAPLVNLNISERGLCVRTAQVVEVRSLVRFKIASAGGRGAQGLRPVECTGRVAWVIQRLDLRPEPPLIFDVGLEFVEPPASLRQWLLRQGVEASAGKRTSGSLRPLEGATVRGRRFTPRLQREVARPPRWHLVVVVDEVPCFSARFVSERAALEAWDEFQRREGRR